MSIKLGSNGQDVLVLQQKLGITADGIFGPLTEQAVKHFQLVHNLVVDGIVGPLTAAAIFTVVVPDPDTDTEIHGIDIYHGDTVHDWSKLVPNGWLFCFIKASEGLTIKDAMYHTHYNNAKSHGLLAGPYHFVHMNQDPKDQAQHFFNCVGALKDEDLPPVLDWEYASGSPVIGDASKAKIFIEECERLFKRAPIIYAGKYTIQDVGSPAWLTKYPLWLAQYKKVPSIPRPWTKFDFWQYSDSTPVPGIGNCDVDVYHGSLNDLKLMIKASLL